MGDVVIMRGAKEAPLVLKDAQPSSDEPVARGLDGAGAASASRVEKTAQSPGGQASLPGRNTDALQIHEVGRAAQPGAAPWDPMRIPPSWRPAPWAAALQEIEEYETKNRRPLPGYSTVPSERMLYSEDILAFVTGAIMNHSHLMRVSLFTMDDIVVPTFSSKMALAATEIYIVLDKNQVNNPSCKLQRKAMLDLHAWGVHMRARSPKGNLMSYNHEKTWLFDQNLLIVGSWNCSENSTNNCEEVCTASKSPVLIASQADHFDMLWETAKEIDWDEIERKEEIAREALTASRNRSPSRSKSRK